MNILKRIETSRLRRTMIKYAQLFIGCDYKWGGETPHGFDCSGFAQECLKSVGKDFKGDQTADALFRLYSGSVVEKPNNRGGCLVFWPGGAESRKTHVAITIDGKTIIEAGGGGSRTRTSLDAEKHKAFVRLRPIEYRGKNNSYVIVDPFK